MVSYPQIWQDILQDSYPLLTVRLEAEGKETGTIFCWCVLHRRLSEADPDLCWILFDASSREKEEERRNTERVGRTRKEKIKIEKEICK